MNDPLSIRLFSTLPPPAKDSLLRVGRTLLAPLDSFQIEVVDRLSYPQAVPMNKLCGMAELGNPEWRQALRDLDLDRRNAPFHRKAWEFAQAVYGLRRLKRLPPEAVALGVGSGHERILYFLANRVAKVVATDLYGGSFAGKEGSPLMLEYPEMFSPFHFRKDHLEARVCDGTNLEFPDRSFDLAFSFSSIEHFGGHTQAVKSLKEMFRVLKPGGIAVITTELILNTLGRIPGFFKRHQLNRIFLSSTGFRLAGGGIDLRIERRFLRDPIDFPFEDPTRPCVVLRKGFATFTSILLFLQKPLHAPAGGEQAITGEERPYPIRRYLHKATITSPVTRSLAKRRTAIRLPLSVRNAGDVVWYNHPGASHTVRIGAHLLAPDGSVLQQNFSRQDLPRSLRPGEEVHLDLVCTAPDRCGDFALEIDLVKEGVLWFGEEGSPTLTVGLRVE